MFITKAQGTIEQKVLKISITVTLFLSITGILFGLSSGSLAIMFDGMFDMVDTAMSILALLVARLLTSEGSRRFQYGYWHVEPMALVFNGGVLILLCVYAFVNAIDSVLSGGRKLNFDLAMIFTLLMATLSISMYIYVQQKNTKINSEFLRLDKQSWLISGIISLSLLIAFWVATLMEGTRYHHLTPYVDPFILAILSFCLIFLPMPLVRDAIRDIFVIAPLNLDIKVRKIMDDLILKKGFKTYTSYVAKQGRAEFIEVHIVVPKNYPISGVEALDVIRQEIVSGLGGDTPQRWITITFTTDETWI